MLGLNFASTRTLGKYARPELCLHQNGMGHIPILHKRFSCLAVALISLEAEFLNSLIHGVFVFYGYERVHAISQWTTSHSG